MDMLPGRIVENLAMRGKLTAKMRGWFYGRGYVEVETPVRIAAPAPEPNIDCPRSGGGWLRASPELQMKRLLAHGMEKIFQIGPCFRKGECGSRHNPEFTMLEWYSRGATVWDILAETKSLLRNSAREAFGHAVAKSGGHEIDLDRPWRLLGVREAFLKWAGWDPVCAFDQDRFDEDMALIIEPSLRPDCVTVLHGYPKEAASLAKLSREEPAVACRWELYIGRTEIANAYGELTCGAEQRKRFMAAREERRLLGEDDYPLDEGFLGDLEAGLMPECGGIALGMDRLAMLFCGEDSISRVRPFCESPGMLL